MTTFGWNCKGLLVCRKAERSRSLTNIIRVRCCLGCQLAPCDGCLTILVQVPIRGTQYSQGRGQQTRPQTTHSSQASHQTWEYHQSLNTDLILSRDAVVDVINLDRRIGLLCSLNGKQKCVLKFNKNLTVNPPLALNMDMRIYICIFFIWIISLWDPLLGW